MSDIAFYGIWAVVSGVMIWVACWLDKRAQRRRERLGVDS